MNGLFHEVGNRLEADSPEKNSLTNQLEGRSERMPSSVLASLEGRSEKMDTSVLASLESYAEKMDASVLSSLEGHLDEHTEKMEAQVSDVDEEQCAEKQGAAIKDAFARLARGEQLTTAEKGNLCEMMMDRYYISKGYRPLIPPHERVTSLDDKGHQGIDGIYEKDGKFVIADAKFGTATLSDTLDGKQMSKPWIDRRLDEAIGKKKADEIRDAYEDDPDNVTTEVYHYDPETSEQGSTYSDTHPVDEDGEKCGERVQVEMYDSNGKVTLLETERRDTDA